MRVAVIGSRKLDVPNLEDFLPEETSEIISGVAKGVDTSASIYAQRHGIILREFLPEYEKIRSCSASEAEYYHHQPCRSGIRLLGWQIQRNRLCNSEVPRDGNSLPYYYERIVPQIVPPFGTICFCAGVKGEALPLAGFPKGQRPFGGVWGRAPAFPAPSIPTSPLKIPPIN